jgi:ADP-ribose pyrophosphatase YjhB (NUDIX family)
LRRRFRLVGGIMGYFKNMSENKPTLTNEYTNKQGVKYLGEYYEVDSFDHLPKDEITQCYGIVFVSDKFLVVNNVNNAGRYTPVGGGVEPGEHPDDALIREVKEESSMRVLNFKPVGYQKVVDTSGTEKTCYQLRYVCTAEPYGPFVADPDGDVTEVVEVDQSNYKKYFDWGAIGERIVTRAVELRKGM